MFKTNIGIVIVMSNDYERFFFINSAFAFPTTLANSSSGASLMRFTLLKCLSNALFVVSRSEERRVGKECRIGF